MAYSCAESAQDAAQVRSQAAVSLAANTAAGPQPTRSHALPRGHPSRARRVSVNRPFPSPPKYLSLADLHEKRGFPVRVTGAVGLQFGV